MKTTWIIYVILTILCWGAYVPTLHQGQTAFGTKGPLRAFLFVGLAYFLVSIYVLFHMYFTRAEPFLFTKSGVSYSTVAGFLGAVGALGVVFAIRHGGSPIIVAPLIFAGAPIMNTLVSMIWHKPAKPPSVYFYLGIIMAAVGAGLALRFKPS